MNTLIKVLLSLKTNNLKDISLKIYDSLFIKSKEVKIEDSKHQINK
ncbi:MAG: hypothetical protein BAJALOKI2v1_30103 [Promethearchaeota archaeon]|nr:MAG: hypothetical protein BAJALOKI2v1_30103 [Candidatus Lokiarchaeota archaeon]